MIHQVLMMEQNVMDGKYHLVKNVAIGMTIMILGVEYLSIKQILRMNALKGR